MFKYLHWMEKVKLRTGNKMKFKHKAHTHSPRACVHLFDYMSFLSMFCSWFWTVFSALFYFEYTPNREIIYLTNKCVCVCVCMDNEIYFLNCINTLNTPCTWSNWKMKLKWNKKNSLEVEKGQIKKSVYIFPDVR